MADENNINTEKQIRLAALYEDIITIFNLETNQDHTALVSALILHLRTRLKMSNTQVMFLLIQLVEDLESMITETSKLEELKNN